MNRLAGAGQPEELRKAVYATLEKIGDYATCRVFAAAIVEGGDWRRTAQHALKRLGHRMGQGDAIWREAFHPALESAPNDEAREALLAIVDGLAGRESLRYLEQILVQDAHPLRAAALRAMARWPQFDAGRTWLTILAKGPRSDEAIAAAQSGIVRVLSRNEIGAHHNHKLQLAADAIKQAPNVEFKRAVLNCYTNPPPHIRGSMPHYFESIKQDPDVGAEVRALIQG
jgi:hypothetical protein